MDHKTQVLIVGAGTGGVSVAARLQIAMPELDIAIVEPKTDHYYQPLWTLVGGGIVPVENSRRPQEEIIPRGVKWIRDAVERFIPEENRVLTRSGASLSYDYLVVAAGIQLDWHKIEGLTGHLGKSGIVSNYTAESAPTTWETLRSMKSGRALFTMPSTPVKCAGAPQKIMWLAEDWFRRQGLRDKVEIHFFSAGARIFGVQKYRDALERLVAKRDVLTHFGQDLVAVRPEARQAIFKNLATGEETVEPYDLLHITPPQGPPDFIKASPLADAAGWVDVHKYTLQHNRYPTVFALGDCSSLPTSRTGAAIRKEAPVLVHNLLAHMRGEALTAHYDGYASCPLVTGYGRLILAEFDYDGKPAESFPFDQAQERYSMYALKVYGLPEMYWNGMLKGRM